MSAKNLIFALLILLILFLLMAGRAVLPVL